MIGRFAKSTRVWPRRAVLGAERDGTDDVALRSEDCASRLNASAFGEPADHFSTFSITAFAACSVPLRSDLASTTSGAVIGCTQGSA